MKPSPANERWLLRGMWALALIYTWWLLRWSVGPDHFFFADDWDWMYRAAVLTFHEQFSVLPRYPMNDRPVGALAFRVLYRLFGLDPVPFHWLSLGLHLANMTMLLLVARRLIASRWVAAAIALAYGTWSAANEGATWAADIFDVLGAALILAVMLTFSSRRWGVRLASVLLFFVALRTKETAIVLPAMLLVWVLVCHHRREWLREAKLTLWPHFLLAAVFVALYIPLLAEHQRVEDTSNPYRMDFSTRAFGEGLYFYVSRMLYGPPWPVGRLIRWTVAMSALTMGIAWRVRATLVGLAGFVIFLLPVIFLSHQRQEMYLYIPAACFVLALGGAAEAAAARLRVSAEWRESAAVAMMLLCVAALPHWAHMRTRAAWLLSHTSQARKDLDTFRAHVGSLRPNARIVLMGFPDDYHVFQTPGCSVLKVLYKVDPVRCEFTDDTAGADVVVVWRREGIEVTAAK